MSKGLFFDFVVDKASKTVCITRDFNAPGSLVWDAFTKAELLDKWTAPHPFSARTKYMDFRVGGKRFYAMVSPDGQEGWILQEYKSITPKTNFQLFNVFTDKDENPAPSGSDWDYTFSENDGITTLKVIIYNDSLERMERMIEMGFKEGYTVSLDALDELLSILNQSNLTNLST